MGWKGGAKPGARGGLTLGKEALGLVLELEQAGQALHDMDLGQDASWAVWDVGLDGCTLKESEERRHLIPLGFDPSLRLGDNPLKRLGFT
ncbi:hypothetical protein L3X38_011138 [Prunus dulcis]|uniref:Uncharacterized protein n=1 Tax=Prunus dulcis TaxID=3755 RepID=A0AAD4WJL1_PRUDU|nr:hypothetical protein L3X38_011138 [Prunus dulcis]